jgi:transglutaminase-like putative cysteine protease
MKKYACLFMVFLQVVDAFAFNTNPKSWSNGMLYEKSTKESIIYLYINPTGEFIWIKDEPYLGIISIKGQWKRNPMSGLLKFFSQDLGRTVYLKDPLEVRPQGLFKRTANTAIFQPAGEQGLRYMLPQILESYTFPPHRDYNFHSIQDIGVKQGSFPWSQEAALDGDAFEVIKKLRQKEYSAQQWASSKYQGDRGNRIKWSTQYSQAFAAGRKLFSGYDSDSAKLRAMCNWIDKKIEYDAEGSQENNKEHSPEFTFVAGYGLCLDMARLLNVFCESQGIPSIQVSGYPLGVSDGKQDPGSDSYHAWNHVRVNGTWWAFDPTWYSPSEPHEHFMVSLAAYQYEHLPESAEALANPYGPSNREQLKQCPVVRQSNMDVIYLSSWEKVVRVDGDYVEVVLYATKDLHLDLHVDSLDNSMVYNSFTLTFGCRGVESIEDKKGKRHQTFQLKRGVNRLQIPLVADQAEYTLINDHFELALWAYRASAHEKLFWQWSECSDTTQYYARAYQYLGQWLFQNNQDFFQMTKQEKQHPNWDLIKKEYHNQRMIGHVSREREKLVAYYSFTPYTIGRKVPMIKVVMDKDWNCLTQPAMVLID